MISKTRGAALSTALLAAMTVSACVDAPSRVLLPPSPSLDAVKFWGVTASTRWNERALTLLVQRPPSSDATSAAVRILTYLSLAQYRAELAAEDGKDGSTHPSVPAAVGGASVAILSGFFPLDVAALESQLDADLAAAPWPGVKNEDRAAGESIGRTIGAAVLAYAATDNYLAKSPGVPPVGPGFWVPSGGAIVRGLYGARPFFMTSGDQLRAPPPPAFGSPDFLAALAQVRAISDTRTPAQTALARSWNSATPPFLAGALNRIADDLIEEHHRTEREAARILAYANAAMFDAQIACADTKFAYWLIRPYQADPAITLVLAPQANPSYPAGHPCNVSALLTVLTDAFPSERTRLEAMIVEAGLSQLYSGIHFPFDIAAGQAIGRAAAALALAGDLR
jgi:membrane-associated phospholipid phosphatase